MNNQYIKEEITRKSRKNLETNENKTIKHKSSVRKSMVVDAHIKKEERSQSNNLTLHFKEGEKNELNPKLTEGRK